MRRASLALVALLAVGTASAEEVPNPEFVRWSKFKEGTSTTQKMTHTIGNLTMAATVTTTLIEVGTEKLVIESAVVVRINGMEAKEAILKTDVTKTVTLPKPVKKDDPGDGRPSGTFEEGTETLKIGGTDIKTKWFKFKSEADGVKTVGKAWLSDDVPGNMVIKQELTITSGVVTVTDKMELIEFKKP